MHLDPFELHRPTTVEETVELAARYHGQMDYLAGGTDLLPNYKMHLNLRPHLISLDQVAELAQHDAARIGAMTRLADLEGDPAFGREYPGVREAIGEVATPLVRASGTVGGNLLLETRCFFFNQSFLWRESLGFCLKADGDRCHVVPQKEKCYATFSGDLAPALLVLGAEVEVAGPGGRRRFPLRQLYDRGGDGIHRTHLAPGELLLAVHLPPHARRARAAYRKLRIRPSFDFPELGIAAAYWPDGGRVGELALAAGGLESSPRTFDELTHPRAGTPLTDPAIEELAVAVGKAVRPVHNTSLDPAYRKKMATVFARRVLRAVRDGADAPEAAA